MIYWENLTKNGHHVYGSSFFSVQILLNHGCCLFLSWASMSEAPYQALVVKKDKQNCRDKTCQSLEQIKVREERASCCLK